MEVHQERVENFKSFIELDDFMIISSALKEHINYHFFHHMVKNHVANTHFVLSNSKWSNNFTVTLDPNADANDVVEVMIDLTIKGLINEFDDSGVDFSTEPIELTFTIRAYVHNNGCVSGDIYLLNSEQKALLEFHKKYEDELRRLDIKIIYETKYQNENAYEFFIRIWKNADREDPTMVKDTGIDFYHEIGETYRNIMYSASCANMWGRYITHFTNNLPGVNGNISHLPKTSFYDKRHIFYLEAAIEELYTFYERIAYIAYLFLKPPHIKKSNLSFDSLFKEKTVKSLKQTTSKLGNNLHFSWFVDRANDKHKKLAEYRHPLVHYKTGNKYIKGSYNAFTRRGLMDNSINNELSELDRLMEGILLFVNQEVVECHTAFEQIVLEVRR